MIPRRAWLVVAPLLSCAGARAPAVLAPPPYAVAFAPPAAPPAPVAPVAPVTTVAPGPTLYQRIGGVEALRAVVPRFLERVAADERINYLFALSDLPTLRGRLVDYFCQATGGPCRYAGRDMRAAHARLPIAARHFDALVEDLVATFDEFHVPPREKAELLAALAPLRGDIVTVR